MLDSSCTESWNPSLHHGAASAMVLEASSRFGQRKAVKNFAGRLKLVFCAVISRSSYCSGHSRVPVCAFFCCALSRVWWSSFPLDQRLSLWVDSPACRASVVSCALLSCKMPPTPSPWTAYPKLILGMPRVMRCLPRVTLLLHRRCVVCTCVSCSIFV